MNIIVDSGASRSKWIFCDNEFNVIEICEHSGINPTSNPKSLEVLHEILGLQSSSINKIYFYCAGTGDQKSRENLHKEIEKFSSEATITIETDLLAACRATLTTKPSIICILGTGVHACVYEENYISEKSVSLGYLFDEYGSGYSLGKQVLKDYFHQRMSMEDLPLFEQNYKKPHNSMLQEIYEFSQPNYRIANYSRFLSKCSKSYRKKVTNSIFNQLLIDRLLPLDCGRKLPIHFVGSIAFHFKNEIMQVLEKQDRTIGLVLSDPLDGLLKYHKING